MANPSYGLFCLTMPAGDVVLAPAAEPLTVISVPSLIHDGLALAPVDRDVGPVDETGPGRGEEGHQGRDLGWLADAPARDGPLGKFVRALLRHALVAGERLLQRVPPVGVHRPRVHRVDPHAVTPVLLGDRGSEVDVGGVRHPRGHLPVAGLDRKSTRLNSSHEWISYAVFFWKKKIIKSIKKAQAKRWQLLLINTLYNKYS